MADSPTAATKKSVGLEIGHFGKKYRDYNPVKGLTDKIVAGQR